jgi:hypothetical protein
MAHKKAGGSTNNGRDSQSKRLGVKRLAVRLFEQATLLFVSAALASTQAKMSALAKITRYLRSQMAQCCLK